MKAFKRCFKIKQALVRFTPEEVKEVLNQKTYVGAMMKISEIKERRKKCN